MLTPNFELNQNDDYLLVMVQIPYAKVSEIDLHFEDYDFMFYSKPYYLRLNLPGKVLFCEEPDIKFDVDKKTVTVRVPKAKPGEVFEGLDLITRLLTPKKEKVVTSPKIEVIGEPDKTEDEEEFDWSIELPLPDDELGNLLGHHCGFANSYSFAVFTLKEETSEIFDVKDPQNKAPKSCKEERYQAELDHFDEDHYIADLYHDEEIQQLLKYRPEWEDLYDEFMSKSSNASPDELIHFTSEERDRLRKLPNKEYLLEKSQVKTALLGLIDIIFAYAYNKRTTEGENTVESAWTVNKLSATLSWLETFSSVSEVALTSIRRSVCYPLYRHFELSLTVLEDVKKIFLLGRKCVLKCLLEIHEMFCLSEPRYILNDLYITDYCVWLQTKRCSTRTLVPLANTLGKLLLTKGDIGLNLVDVESFATVAWMSHNSSSKQLLNPRSKKPTEDAKCQEKSHSTESNTNDLSLDLEKLSFQQTPSNIEHNNIEEAAASLENANSLYNNLCSEYESCSSCTSDSSDSSSNTFETDSTEELSSEDTGSSTDSDDDTGSSDSDNGSHSHLLRKENGERLR